jgi:hypothetical protein
MTEKKKRPPRFDDIIALSHQPPAKKPVVSPFTAAYDAEERRKKDPGAALHSALLQQQPHSPGTVPSSDTVPFEGSVPCEESVPFVDTVRPLDRTVLDSSHDKPQAIHGRPALIGYSSSKTKATVPFISTVPTAVSVPTKGTVPRIYKCSTVQDGHSFAEDRLYNALWNYRNARIDSENSRLVTAGWDLMSKLSGMTPNNARQNCFRLIQKLALEKVQAHNSDQRIGTTYRIYSYSAIIRKRKESGLEWVVRNRGGVAFVNPLLSTETVPLEVTVPTKGTVPTSSTAIREETAAPPSQGTPTVPTEGTPLSHTQVTTSQTSSSVSVVSDRLRKLISIDAAAVRQIIEGCEQYDPLATAEEIAHFTEIKIAQHKKNTSVRNLPGLLISSVMDYFRPGSGELADYRATKVKEVAANRVLEDRLRAALEDPLVPEDEKKLARSALGI